MAQDLQNSLFDAMKTMIEGFDQTGTLTIDAEIYKVIDASLGRYMVKYQGATFNAVAVNSSLVLQEGEKVTVLIQNGDFTKERLILTSKNLDNNNIVTMFEDLTYLITSGDLINNIGDVELSSYEITEIEQNISNLPNFREIFRKLSEIQKNFVLQVDMRTNLTKEQQNALGQYGCALIIPFINSNGEHIAKEYSIDTSNLIGAPYRLKDWAKQELFVDIPLDYIYDIEEDIKIKFFDKEFILDDSKTEIKDIFFRNTHFYSIEMLPSSVYSGYYVKVTPTQGNYFYTGLNITKTLTAEVIYDGKKLDDSEFSCYWFKENAFIDIDDENYSYIGGVGWEGINDKQLIGTKEDGTPIYQFVPSGLTTTISADEIITSLNYKCVIVVNDKTTIYGQITIANLLTNVSFELSTEDNRTKYLNSPSTEIKINATIFLEGVTDIATEEGLHNEITYSWSRYNRRGELVPNSLTLEDINKLVQQDNRQCYQSTVSFYSEDLIETNRIVCSALYNNRIIGTKALVLSSTTESKYSVMIEGENTLYKYDAFGNSPLKETYNAPATAKINEKNPIKAIGYKVFNEKGEELTKGGYKSVVFNWLIPINSLIEPLDVLDKDSDDKPIVVDDRYHVISGEGLETNALFNYTIANKFNRNKSDNTLVLELNIAGEIITRSIDILFIKEGDMGTNGTTYSASLGIKEQNGDEIFDYGEKDVGGQEYKYRFVYLRNETTGNHCYCDYKGELVRWNSAPHFVPRVYESGKPLVLNVDYTVNYSLYDEKQQGNDYFGIQVVDENTGECSITINTPNQEPDTNNTFVLMAEIIISLDSIADTKKRLYAYYPLEMVIMGNSNITIPGIYGGFNEVVYASDGSNPSYDGSTPFSVGFREPELAELINGLELAWDYTDIFSIEGERSDLSVAIPILTEANYNSINDWITSTATRSNDILYKLNDELFLMYDTNGDIKFISPEESITTVAVMHAGTNSSWTSNWNVIDPTDCIRSADYSDGTELVDNTNMPESNSTWYYNSYDHYLTHSSQKASGSYPDTCHTHKIGENILTFSSAYLAMIYMNIQISIVADLPTTFIDKTIYLYNNEYHYIDYSTNLPDSKNILEEALLGIAPPVDSYTQGYNSYQTQEPKYEISENYNGFNCDQIHKNGQNQYYHSYNDTVNILYAAYNLTKNNTSATKYFSYRDKYFKLENNKALLVEVPFSETVNPITIRDTDLIGVYNTTGSYVNKTYKIIGTDMDNLYLTASAAQGEEYAFATEEAYIVTANLYRGNNYAIKLTDTTTNTDIYLKTSYNQIWETIQEEDIDFSPLENPADVHQYYHQEFNLIPKGKYDSATARHYVKATVTSSDISDLIEQKEILEDNLVEQQTLDNAFNETKDSLETMMTYFNSSPVTVLQSWIEILRLYSELFKTQKQTYNVIQNTKKSINELLDILILSNDNTVLSTLQNLLTTLTTEEPKILNACPSIYNPVNLYNMTINTQNLPQHLQIQIQLLNDEITATAEILDGFEEMTRNTNMQLLSGLYGELDDLEDILPSEVWQKFSSELENFRTVYGITSQQKEKILRGALQKSLGVLFNIDENGEMSLNNNTKKYSETSPYISKISTLTATLQYLDNFTQHLDENIIIVKPIVVHNNAYEASDINGWDGNKIDMGNNSEYIMSPKVGAGIKNDDNTFTGIVMGRKNIYDSDSPKDSLKIGLFGQYHGVETMFLNAKNGAAIFGAAGETLLPDGQSTVGGAQIIIDPVQKNALLYSSNFYKYYGDDGLPLEYYEDNETGEGMQINLSKPEIKYGNGNFSVTENGFLTADGGGRIAGWRIDEGKLHATNTENDKYYVRNNNLYCLDENNSEILVADNVILIEENYSDNLMTLSSGLTRVKDKNGNIIKDEDGEPIYISDNDKKLGARIYSYTHDDISSEEEGFYIDKDGASWGNGLMFDKNGLIRSGQVNGDGKYFTITGNTTLGNPFISYGHKVNYGQGEYKNTLTEFPTVLGEQDYKVIDVSSQQELNATEKDEDSLYRLTEKILTEGTAYYTRDTDRNLVEITEQEAHSQETVEGELKDRFKRIIEVNIEDWIRNSNFSGINFGISFYPTYNETNNSDYQTRYYLSTNGEVRPCTSSEGYYGAIPGYVQRGSNEYFEINVRDRLLNYTSSNNRAVGVLIYDTKDPQALHRYFYLEGEENVLKETTIEKLYSYKSEYGSILPEYDLIVTDEFVRNIPNSNRKLYFSKFNRRFYYKYNDELVGVDTYTGSMQYFIAALSMMLFGKPQELYDDNNNYYTSYTLVPMTPYKIYKFKNDYDDNYSGGSKLCYRKPNGELVVSSNSYSSYNFDINYYFPFVKTFMPTFLLERGQKSIGGNVNLTNSGSCDKYYCYFLSNEEKLYAYNKEVYTANYGYSRKLNIVSEQDAKYKYTYDGGGYLQNFTRYGDYSLSTVYRDSIGRYLGSDDYDILIKFVDSSGIVGYMGRNEANSDNVRLKRADCYETITQDKYSLVTIEDKTKIPTNISTGLAFVCPKYTTNTSYYIVSNNTFNSISETVFNEMTNQRTSKEDTVYFGTDGISIGEHFKIANTGKDSDFLISYKLTGMNDYSDERGFYLSTDGLKIGNGFKVSDLGMLKIGNVETKKDYFTMGTILDTNAFLAYGYRTDMSIYDEYDYAYYPTFDGGLDGKLLQTSLAEAIDIANSYLEVDDIVETSYHNYYQCKYIPEGFPNIHIIETSEEYYRSGYATGLTKDGLRVFNFDYVISGNNGHGVDASHSMQHFHPIIIRDGWEYNPKRHQIKDWNAFHRLCAYGHAISFSLPNEIKSDIQAIGNNFSKDIFDLSPDTLSYFFSQYCYYFIKPNDSESSNLKLDVATSVNGLQNQSKALTRGYVCKFKDNYYKVMPSIIPLTPYESTPRETNVLKDDNYAYENYTLVYPTSDNDCIDDNNYDDKKSEFDLSTIYFNTRKNNNSYYNTDKRKTVTTKDKLFSVNEYAIVKLMDQISMKPQSLIADNAGWKVTQKNNKELYDILNYNTPSDRYSVYWNDGSNGLLAVYQKRGDVLGSYYMYESGFTPTYIVYNKAITWADYEGYRFKLLNLATDGTTSINNSTTGIYGFNRWGTEEGLTAEERRCSVLGALLSTIDNGVHTVCDGAELACTEEENSYTLGANVFISNYTDFIKFKHLDTPEEIKNTIKSVRQKNEEGLYLGKDGISIGNRFRFGLGERENEFMIACGIEGFRADGDKGIYLSKNGSRFGGKTLIFNNGDFHFGKDVNDAAKNYDLIKFKTNDWEDGDGETSFLCSNNKMELWRWLPGEVGEPATGHGGHTLGWYFGTDGCQWGRNLTIGNDGIMYLGRDGGKFETGTSAQFGLNRGRNSGTWDTNNTVSFRLNKDSMEDDTEGVYYGTDGINIGTESNHMKVWANGNADITLANIKTGTVGGINFDGSKQLSGNGGTYYFNGNSSSYMLKSANDRTTISNSGYLNAQDSNLTYAHLKKQVYLHPHLSQSGSTLRNEFDIYMGSDTYNDTSYFLKNINFQNVSNLNINMGTEVQTNYSFYGHDWQSINSGTVGQLVLGNYDCNYSIEYNYDRLPQLTESTIRVNSILSSKISDTPKPVFVVDLHGNVFIRGNLYVCGDTTSNYQYPNSYNNS